MLGQGEQNTDRQRTKAPTGIQGFDQSTHGGLPRGRTSLIVGGPGTGKTIFALQTLVHGARVLGEPAIFVAFEENSRQIVANAASFGWDLPALEKDQLFFLDARLSLDAIAAGRFDLAGMLASLGAKVDEMGAKRIAFDSIDVLLTLMEDPILERREVYRIHEWLSDTELTGIVTSRIGSADPLHSEHYGFMQFMADCVVRLSHKVEDRVSLRTVRAIKYRGSSFAENELPMVIGPEGIAVGIAVQLEPAYEVYTERVSTGIEPLDLMLAGGYYRGSTVLVSGAPGTAKSTLCGTFLAAACERSERALYVSFDESAGEITRNLASVNIKLNSHIESGLLKIYAARTDARSADQHLMRLAALIGDHEPHCVAIDPLSAMTKAGGGVAAMSMAERLMALTKARGITLLLTSLLAGSSPEMESTSLPISTIADTWIHLSYLVKAGERNRALSIVKSRGTSHSNQVRELVLSSNGITLEEVYTAGGEVLMGTLRWEKEQELKTEEARRQADLRRKERELALAETEAQARMEAIQREIDSLRSETDLLQRERQALEARFSDTHEGIRRLRQDDLQVLDSPKGPPDSEPPVADKSGEVQ
jgi:circadian clock protein KaiC